MNKSDIGVVAIIYAVCALFLYLTLEFPPAAQTYPLCLITALALLNTLYVAKMVHGLLRQGVINDLPEVFAGFQPRQFFLVAAGCVLYVAGVFALGFYLTSVIYLIVMLLLLKVSLKVTLITVVAMGALIYLVFSLFLKVPLPVGAVFA